MNHPHGIYKVVGRTEYRGHKPGETFVARLDMNAAARAIKRGSIALVDQVDPSLDPGRLVLPKGWLE